MCIHPPYIHVNYFTYIPNSVGIFVSGTCLAIACKGEAAAHIYAQMLYQHIHIAFWQHELYLECGSHVPSVIYVKCMYSALIPSDFICGIDMFVKPAYMHVQYLAYMVYMPNLEGIFILAHIW